jgi:hypothetical protein
MPSCWGRPEASSSNACVCMPSQPAIFVSVNAGKEADSSTRGSLSFGAPLQPTARGRSVNMQPATRQILHATPPWK